MRAIFILPLFALGLSIFLPEVSHALPAFAIREGVSCTVCHANGSAPHLTKTGYLYRRAGFRFPTYIGQLEHDEQAMKIVNHMAAGINVDYQLTTEKPPGESESLTQNGFNVREVEIWPLVGSFFGNYGVWSELDMSPFVAADRGSPTPPNSTTAPDGGVELTQADMRYVWGNADVFYNVRAGLIAPEGFGASDQWIDDGNIPLFDQLTGQYNEDTLALPFGAMETPQMGAEFGINYYDTHVTLGVMNGFDGTNGFANQMQSTATPQLMNPDSKGAKDYKVQWDQFIGDEWAVTAAYYNGTISLLDPSNTMVWQNNYALWRLYLTYMIDPNVVDLMAGGAQGTYDYVQTGSNAFSGTFEDRGAFVGANYYVTPHLTLSGRLDYFQYNYGLTDSNPRAQGYALMASLPYGNNIFVFHFNQTYSDFTGLESDLRLEWRFLF